MKSSTDPVLCHLRDRQDFPPAAKRVRIILEQIGRCKNISVLDAGCGPGWVSHFLERAGLRTVMLDLSEEMLEKCVALKANSLLSSPLFRGSVTALPFRNEAFDVCILLDVIEHVSALSRCMDEVWRVLRPGGKLLLTTPNKFGTYTVIYDIVGRRLFEKEISDHVHYFSLSSLRSKFVESGFKVEKVEKIEFLSPLLHAVSRNLKHAKDLTCYLSKMDVLLSDSIPTQIVSEWFITAAKIGRS